MASPAGCKTEEPACVGGGDPMETVMKPASSDKTWQIHRGPRVVSGCDNFHISSDGKFLIDEGLEDSASPRKFVITIVNTDSKERVVLFEKVSEAVFLGFSNDSSSLVVLDKLMGIGVSRRKGDAWSPLVWDEDSFVIPTSGGLSTSDDKSIFYQEQRCIVGPHGKVLIVVEVEGAVVEFFVKSLTDPTAPVLNAGSVDLTFAKGVVKVDQLRWGRLRGVGESKSISDDGCAHHVLPPLLISTQDNSALWSIFSVEINASERMGDLKPALLVTGFSPNQQVQNQRVFFSGEAGSMAHMTQSHAMFCRYHNGNPIFITYGATGNPDVFSSTVLSSPVNPDDCIDPVRSMYADSPFFVIRRENEGDAPKDSHLYSVNPEKADLEPVPLKGLGKDFGCVVMTGCATCVASSGNRFMAKLK